MGRNNGHLNGSHLEDLETIEARHRKFFEFVLDGVIVLDEETRRIIEVNPFMEKLLDHSRPELLGKSLGEIGVFDSEAQIASFFQSLLDNNYVRYDELSLVRSDGTQRQVELAGNRYTKEGLRVVQCNIRDITERRRTEKELKRKEKFLRVILRNLTDSIVACDPEGRLTLFNQTLRESDAPEASIPPEEWAERFDLYNPDGKTLMKMEDVPLYRALHEGSIQDVEMATLNSEGRMLTLLSTGQALIDDYGEKMGAVVVMHDITARKKAGEALRQAENKYRNLVELSPGILVLCEPEPPYATIYISPNIKTFGFSPDEWYSNAHMWASILHPEDRERVLKGFEFTISRGLEAEMEYRIIARDGSIHWWQDKGRFVFDDAGNRTGWQALILDITATKKLEMQFHQSQKLESVGMLAGGIAHDFNNMLTAINGYSDLALRQLKENDPVRQNILEIRKAGERSADLTRQLLAFGRGQVLQPVVLDLNDAILDTIKMLERLVGEHIQCTTVLSPKTGRVNVDPTQFSQIVTNLVVNARDAMPEGGKLTIETANVFLDPVYSRQHVNVLPGAYVLMAISDTGAGMSSEVRQHIFEPFFTTKEVGKGTGLGLSTVHGIIKQSGGSIEVYSEEGVGTTFKVYFPRVIAEAGIAEMSDDQFDMPAGTETVLLVEDEEPVRNLSRKILQECGYTVIEAMNGQEALSLYKAAPFHIDLLMTDVVMPKMGGRELAMNLKEALPDLSVLFTSGYADDAVVRHGVLEINSNFIQKPFRPGSLAKKIRKMLDDTAA